MDDYWVNPTLMGGYGWLWVVTGDYYWVVMGDSCFKLVLNNGLLFKSGEVTCTYPKIF